MVCARLKLRLGIYRFLKGFLEMIFKTRFDISPVPNTNTEVLVKSYFESFNTSHETDARDTGYCPMAVSWRTLFPTEMARRISSSVTAPILLASCARA